MFLKNVFVSSQFVSFCNVLRDTLPVIWQKVMVGQQILFALVSDLLGNSTCFSLAVCFFTAIEW